jgi:hypothetical protein
MVSRYLRVALAAACGVAALWCAVGVYAADHARFESAGSMTTPRAFHTASLLKDGRVLLTGGSSNGSESGLLASAELYDPKLSAFSATGSLLEPLASHTAAPLLDGRVLIDGGDTAIGFSDSAELYDPGTGTFAATGSMSMERALNTTTLLSEGPLRKKVLVAGGIVDLALDATDTAELFDPETGGFTATGSMHFTRSQHTATLLHNGKVLIAGGTDTNGNFLASAELYDTHSQEFEPTGDMTVARANHIAALLPSGKVLIAGGFSVDQSSNLITLSSAEIYDPQSGTFGAVADMTQSRGDFTGTLLDDGAVLMAGGFDNTGAVLSSAELFRHRSFSATATMETSRSFHTATLLKHSDRVLLTGGLDNAGNTLSSAELFVSH